MGGEKVEGGSCLVGGQLSSKRSLSLHNAWSSLWRGEEAASTPFGGVTENACARDCTACCRRVFVTALQPHQHQ